MAVTAIGGRLVEGDKSVLASALGGVWMVPFIDEKPLEGGEQEPAEPALFLLHGFEKISFQQAGEELLGQVAGGLVVTAFAQE